MMQSWTIELTNQHGEKSTISGDGGVTPPCVLGEQWKEYHRDVVWTVTGLQRIGNMRTSFRLERQVA